MTPLKVRNHQKVIYSKGFDHRVKTGVIYPHVKYLGKNKAKQKNHTNN